MSFPALLIHLPEKGGERLEPLESGQREPILLVCEDHPNIRNNVTGVWAERKLSFVSETLKRQYN